MKTRKNRSRSVYTRKHFDSNDGMLTTVWGPSAWHLLHTISFNYPVKPNCDEKRQYRDFVLNFQSVLPCGKCRENLKKNFKRLPFLWKHMESRHTFSKYIYDLHEIVNKMLHKKSGLSYQDVRERYEHFRARCAPQNTGLVDRRKTCKNTQMSKTPSLDIQGQDQGKNPLGQGKTPLGQSKSPLGQSKSPLGQGKNPLEKGCTEPIYGEKSKCVLKIIPQKTKCETFQMDKTCIKRRKP